MQLFIACHNHVIFGPKIWETLKAYISNISGIWDVVMHLLNGDQNWGCILGKPRASLKQQWYQCLANILKSRKVSPKWLLAFESQENFCHLYTLDSLPLPAMVMTVIQSFWKAYQRVYQLTVVEFFCIFSVQLENLWKLFYATKTGLGKVENIKVRMIEWSFLLFRMSSRYISHRWEVFEQQDVHVEYKWKPN